MTQNSTKVPPPLREKRRIWQNFLTVFLCLIIYIPFFLLGMLMIYNKRLGLKLKKWIGIGYKEHGRLGIVSRRNPITDIVSVSSGEEEKFLKYRSPVYLYRMTFWTARELARFLVRGQEIELIDEADLGYAIFNSVFAHSLKWMEDEQMYRLKMEGFDDFFLFRGFFWDAREVWLNNDCTKMKLVFSGRKEISWPCEPSKLNEWNLAKLHAQVCLTYYAPGLSHNHVHFVYPSSMTLVAKRYLDKKSFLYKLLEPHMQFTERINFQALQIGKATNNKRSLIDRHFCFWQPIPLTVEQFVEGVAKKCHKHYHQYYEEHVKKYGYGSHCNFPPNYVQDEDLQKIPYMKFLAGYYHEIRNFVASISEFINPEDWKTMQDVMKEHVPGFENVNAVDGITTFIHQVGVVHFCDHESYLRFFARKYGCMAIRTPYEPWSNRYHWDTVAAENPEIKTALEVQENPLKLIKSRDIMRTRCFLNVFVDFIPDWSLDLRLISTKYDFKETGEDGEDELIKDAVNLFKQNLIELDKSFIQQEPENQIRFGPSGGNVLRSGGFSVGQGLHGRAVNMQLIPLNEIIRCVCF